jgi:hypothetical protein
MVCYTCIYIQARGLQVVVIIIWLLTVHGKLHYKLLVKFGGTALNIYSEEKHGGGAHGEGYVPV